MLIPEMQLHLTQGGTNIIMVVMCSRQWLIMKGQLRFFHFIALLSAINANSRNAIAFNSRGNEYYNGGNVQQAMADYERAIEIFPFYSAPIFNEGVVYYKQRDYIKADYLYSQALKYDTLSPVLTSLRFSILYNYAGEKMALKKYDEAVVLLKKAEKESPETSELYNNLGYAYFSLGKKDSALYAYSRAIELKPNSAFYYTNRSE